MAFLSEPSHASDLLVHLFFFFIPIYCLVSLVPALGMALIWRRLSPSIISQASFVGGFAFIGLMLGLALGMRGSGLLEAWWLVFWLAVMAFIIVITKPKPVSVAET